MFSKTSSTQCPFSSIQCPFTFSDLASPGRVLVSEDVWNSLLSVSGQDSATGDFEIRNQDVDGLGSITTLYGVILSKEYINMFSSNSNADHRTYSCSVTALSPIQLTDVTLIASNVQAFLTSREEREKMERWLCMEDRIIRSGDFLYGRLTGESFEDCYNQFEPSCSFEIGMSEPVLQGYAVLGRTRFLVTAVYPTLQDLLPSATVSLNGSTLSPNSDDEEFTIDENFLAWSSLHDIGLELSAFPMHTSQDSEGLQPTTRPDGRDSVSIPLMFFPKPLLHHPNHVVNESCAMFVHTKDLGKIGIFSGDWVLVGSQKGDMRLAQIHAIEDNIYSATHCYGHPFGAEPPFVPTAKSLTLSRIASPLSLDKNYQSAMLWSVKLYFETARRLVKKGDIIAIPLHMKYGLVVDENIGDLDAMNDIDNRLEMSSMGPMSGFFLVTNVVHDVLDVNDSNLKVDAFSGSIIGELGCWIDSSKTRVIQAGIEHAFVPDTQYYSSISEETGTLFDQCSSSIPFHKLCELASAVQRENVSMFGLDLTVLLKGSAGSSMILATHLVAAKLGFHLLKVNVYDTIGETEAKTEARLREQFDAAISCSPCIFLLQDIDALAQTTQVESGREFAVVPLFREFLRELDMNWKRTGFPVPSESERCVLLKSMLSDSYLAADVPTRNLTVQTAALTDNDLADFVSQARLYAIERTKKTVETMSYHQLAVAIHHAGLILTGADFEGAIVKARASFSHGIGAPSIPSVSWDDVGGLAKVKKDILDTIQLPLDNPTLFVNGLKQRSGDYNYLNRAITSLLSNILGILLYGPPGTGKTLLAKAVATSCSLNFFSVKGPELLNMYIGESEANVRRVFQRARDAKPCVIFFDELDSVAPKRGNHGDSGGVMDRIVSQLLAELDGMSSADSGDVFVIGATNRPDLLDSALLRPGRFDRLLYLGVSDTHEAQLAILEALTRKFCLHSQVNLKSFVEQCPFNYTGADFYALCSDAILKAMARKAQEVENTIERMNRQSCLPIHQYPITPQYYLSELASSSETDVVVSLDDFQEALRELVPSVSQSEMEHYALIQKRFASNIGEIPGNEGLYNP
ncbi:hypothetical protein EW145_g4336 [Phellinidium pouzarii]|uniref:Peroxisomal ATPase PEX6 n=1 Tax=Phellinidium pouzarii TaxID=167371 RepID=A0A4V3XCJ1_9AGAM|nr:hypothetical protein EW145_g4336 [Phellinidium pouzarii]